MTTTVLDVVGTESAPAPVSSIDPTHASDAFLGTIPRDFARQHLIISQGRDGSDNDPTDEEDARLQERFIIAESTSPAAIFNVGVLLQVEPVASIGDAETIARAIDEAYSDAAKLGSDDGTGAAGHNTTDLESQQSSGEVDRLIGEADRDLLSTLGKGPIVKLVDALLFEALGRGASDVHIHPLTDSTLVRYRLDGVLHTARNVPRTITPALTSRIKVMARMDIAERRMPQDGRASVTIGDRSIDLRISTLPTSGGERVVIRLLDNTKQLGDFKQLGMPPEMEQAYLDRASAASGMILLTGPTGSGKTTTLYATLRTVGSAEVNIMTIEDPIEYELSMAGGGERHGGTGKGVVGGNVKGVGSGVGGGGIGGGGAAISQSQVNAKKGVTFATGLRHILRQDPDIVMVGEIRDGETARIAIQSSLTGHLVFSTLHTNDAASAITRLVDLGVEPYLVSASLSCVLAQRLVRTIHAACGGTGCEACFGSGFKGRTGLFELLVINERIRELIASGSSLASIRQAAREHSPPIPPMRTLAEDGQRLIELGRTNLLEVQRVVQGAS